MTTATIGMVFSDSQRAAMLARAEAVVGTQWRAGGRTISEGMDCLGVLMDIYAAAGIALPEVGGETRAGILSALFETVDGIPAFGDVARWTNRNGGAHVAVVLCKPGGTRFFVQACGNRCVHCRPIRDALRECGHPQVAYLRYTGGAA